MSNRIKNIILIGMSGLCISCTFAMQEAYAPSNPPQAEKKIFDKATMYGCYQHEIKKELNSPKMFLWPVTKLDSVTNEWVTMSLDEQSNVRQEIVSLADQVEELSLLRRAEEERIAQAFDLSLKDYEYQFTKNKCYSYCDPNDFLCDPTDITILQVDVWKEPSDPIEMTTIADCQSNQKEREEIRKLKQVELTEKVEPIRKEEGMASLSLLKVIGDQNFFPALSKFEFKLGAKTGMVEIKIIYGDVVFSSDKSAKDLISEIKFDQQNGYLTFKMNAIDTENENKVIGQFFFDLELNPSEASFKVEGDIRLSYLSGKKERVGRFSSSGRIVKEPKLGQTCEK